MTTKAIRVCVLVASLVAAGVVLAGAVKGTSQPNSPSPVVLPVADLKWTDLDTPTLTT